MEKKIKIGVKTRPEDENKSGLSEPQEETTLQQKAHELTELLGPEKEEIPIKDEENPPS